MVGPAGFFWMDFAGFFLHSFLVANGLVLVRSFFWLAAGLVLAPLLWMFTCLVFTLDTITKEPQHASDQRGAGLVTLEQGTDAVEGAWHTLKVTVERSV